MELGNLGDSKSFRGGLMEMRIDYGAGYCVYYVRRGTEIVILLCGGDKRTQQQGGTLRLLLYDEQPERQSRDRFAQCRDGAATVLANRAIQSVHC